MLPINSKKKKKKPLLGLKQKPGAEKPTLSLVKMPKAENAGRRNSLIII
jgi:hypothetical protein